MQKRYIVKLEGAEREMLEGIVRKQRVAALKRQRAKLFLLSDAGQTDSQIAKHLDMTARNVAKIRQRFVEEGLEAALKRKPHCRYRPVKLDGKAEAKLITLACSAPPEGRKRWTIRLLSKRLVELDIVDHIAPETVRQRLKKTNLSLG